MHELPSTQQEGVKERVTKEEVYQELHKGYTYLQGWWKNILNTFSDGEPIEEIARRNWGNPKNDRFQTGKPIFLHIIRAWLGCLPTLDRQVWYQAVPFLDLEMNRSTLEIYPCSEDYTDGVGKPMGYVPRYYPFYSIRCHAENGLETLYSLTIRHHSRSTRTDLIETSIDLSSSEQVIDGVRQTAKDQVFFPRSEPYTTKNAPQQEFLLVARNSEIFYRFQYRNRGVEWSSGYWRRRKRAYVAAQRRSFLPYGTKFDVTSAIQNAYQFKPVVLPPHRQYHQEELWQIFNQAIDGKIPETQLNLFSHPTQ